jgi:hypothetical protein
MEAADIPETESATVSAPPPRRDLVTQVYTFTWQYMAWIILGGLTAMFIIAALWQPADEPTLILCPFRALTGLPCPGCGMTRAFCAIAHGHLFKAIGFNAISPIAFLGAVFAWATALATVANFQTIRSTLLRLIPGETLSRFIFGGVMVWWALRLVFKL